MTGKTAINALLVIASIAFVVGLVAPMLTLTKLVLIVNTFSVLTGTLTLLKEGEYLLFIIIFGFSVVLPCIKITLLFKIWNSDTPLRNRAPRPIVWLSSLGKWSMLDVFVVAVLLASIKLGALASVEIHYGLYAFALSVILIMIATGLVMHSYKRKA